MRLVLPHTTLLRSLPRLLAIAPSTPSVRPRAATVSSVRSSIPFSSVSPPLKSPVTSDTGISYQVMRISRILDVLSNRIRSLIDTLTMPQSGSDGSDCSSDLDTINERPQREQIYSFGQFICLKNCWTSRDVIAHPGRSKLRGNLPDQSLGGPGASQKSIGKDILSLDKHGNSRLEAFGISADVSLAQVALVRDVNASCQPTRSPAEGAEQGDTREERQGGGPHGPDGRSTTGSVSKLAGGPISCRFTRRNSVPLSYTKQSIWCGSTSFAKSNG